MRFESWVAAQRASITRLHVVRGQYATHFHARERRYSAAELTTTSEPVARVDHFVGAVRITVTVGAAEYVFEPSWVSGRGLAVVRRSPSKVASRETAEETRGRALAALRCAAERAYEQQRSLALAASDSDVEQDIALRRLAGQVPNITEEDDLDAALRLSLIANLQGRDDGVEFTCAPRECQCIACGAAFAKDQHGPVIEFGSTVICGPCLRPARAA